MNSLYICGDIHGNVEDLVWTLAIKNNLHDVSVIVVGDFGVGFGEPGSMKTTYNNIIDRLEKYNIELYTIRGNHDNPEWFDGKHNFPRLTFLEDHKQIEICGKSIYPIGGATSIDRLDRIKQNAEWEKRGSAKKCYWAGESVVKKKDNLPVKVDILLSHEAPLTFEPVLVRNQGENLNIYEDILSDRKYLDYVLGEINIGKWFFGHYHKSYTGFIGEMMYRCLSESELCEVC